MKLMKKMTKGYYLSTFATGVVIGASLMNIVSNTNPTETYISKNESKMIEICIKNIT